MTDRHAPCPNCDAPKGLHPPLDLSKPAPGIAACSEAEARQRALDYQ